MRYATVVAFALTFLAAGTTSTGYAQALARRTWVSSVGNDANPCTQTAPCLTFAGALTKTEAWGEIDALDAGSFGRFTITKAIVIDGGGTLAAITAPLISADEAGIVVEAGVGDVIVLRNLVINGVSTGSFGIWFKQGKHLIIENTRIFGFGNRGVMVGAVGGVVGTVVISNSTISTLPHPSQAIGVHSRDGITTVSHSVISGNEIGLFAEGSSVINADSNVLTGNGTAVQTNGGTLRLSNNDVYGNLTGFGCGPGVLASAGNNRKGNNTGGTVPACAPNATITQQ